MRWSCVLSVLAMLLAPAGVRADDEAEAKAAYARGRGFFKAARYPEAVVELKKAYALKPHPALLRYMGDTYYKMNKARLAIEHYKKYLTEAPDAPDKDKIEAKVKQLELIVGPGEEGTAPARESAPMVPTPAPAVLTPAPAVPAAAPAPSRARIADAPTGEDREVPLALRRRSLVEQPQPVAPPRRANRLAIAKWTTLGIGVAGLAVGLVFNRMAASKASEINDAVVYGCPDKAPDCGGNPDKNLPVRSYSESDYNVLQANKLYRQVSLATFIVGGAVAATSVVLFALDRKGREQRAPRASVAPMLGGNTWGLCSEVNF